MGIFKAMMMLRCRAPHANEKNSRQNESENLNSSHHWLAVVSPKISFHFLDSVRQHQHKIFRESEFGLFSSRRKKCHRQNVSPTSSKIERKPLTNSFLAFLCSSRTGLLRLEASTGLWEAYIRELKAPSTAVVDGRSTEQLHGKQISRTGQIQHWEVDSERARLLPSLPDVQEAKRSK